MASISFGFQRGFEASGMQMSSVTVGTNAPAGTSDVEVRFNSTDQNGKNLNDFDIVRMLRAAVRWVETNGSTAIALTTQPSGPPS
jgi:hypothetical protein